jgi:hypothetical protein
MIARVVVAASAALLAVPPIACAQDTAASAAAATASPQAVAEYRRKLRDYTLASQRFEAEASAYWTTITEKRRARQVKRRSGQDVSLDDYVLTQPPVYAGPPRPVDPSAPDRPPPATRDTKYVPTIPEMLASAQKYFQFTPYRGSEIEFKRAYAKALAAEGVSRELAVRIYAFETGGIGTYDVQSGLLNARPGAKPLSAAVGYNQLLITYTMHLLADQGDDIVRALAAKSAASSGEARDAMTAKVAVLKRMIAFSRTVPADWNSLEKLGETPQGWGVQVLLLDIDVGPLLQARKLNGSIRYARMRGHREQLTAAELQMMNLMGDGSGLDIITMPQAMRESVPTANFFQRRGYERNAVASRNNTVAKLLTVTDQRMDAAVQQPGARDLAASF